MKDLKIAWLKFVYNFNIEENIRYTLEDWDKNTVYIFENYDKFKEYFVTYRAKDISESILRECIFATFNDGRVIAFEGKCDYLITKYIPYRKYTPKDIQEIHERGHLTPWEAVDEWVDFGLCVPANSARCHVFNNCYECLVNYAGKDSEYPSIKEERINAKPYQRELRKK